MVSNSACGGGASRKPQITALPLESVAHRRQHASGLDPELASIVSEDTAGFFSRKILCVLLEERLRAKMRRMRGSPEALALTVSTANKQSPASPDH